MTHRDPHQISLFQGLEMAEEGMARAIDHASIDYRSAFRRVAVALANSGVEYTSEDITREVGLPIGRIGMHRNNAVGAMMNALAREGIHRKTGRKVASRRTVSHATEINTWVGIRR